MWPVFALFPFLVLAPAVVIGALMVFTLLAAPLAIIMVLAGLCIAIFDLSRRVIRSVRKPRQAHEAHRQPTLADANLSDVGGAAVQTAGAQVDQLPQPGVEFD
jgi:membrane protein implicated in regulation of membrane protease activity